MAVVDKTTGTGYVKANAAGISQPTAQESTAAIAFTTPSERFTGMNQAGGFTIKGIIQNVHIAWATNSYAFIQIWAVTLDLYSSLTLANLTYQKIYDNIVPGSVASSALDFRVSLSWISSHIYRTTLFVVAKALAGGPGNTAEARTNFTLNSITWDASADFPSVQVNVPGSTAIPPVASQGDTIAISGSGFTPSQNVRVKLIAVDSYYRPVKGGTNQVVVQPFLTGRDGSIQTSFKVPSNATPVPGIYAVRIANATGEDAVDSAITLSVPLVVPTLPPTEMIPAVLILVAIPIIVRRIRPRRP